MIICLGWQDDCLVWLAGIDAMMHHAPLRMRRAAQSVRQSGWTAQVRSGCVMIVACGLGWAGLGWAGLQCAAALQKFCKCTQ